MSGNKTVKVKKVYLDETLIMSIAAGVTKHRLKQ